MPTSDNLKAAFAGESQANRKYLAFAKKAEADGFRQVARLFRAVAEAETVHAHAHLRALQGVKSTADNLQAAIDGEGHEFREMYPPFVEQAEREAQRAALNSFKYAMQVEQTHLGLYSDALQEFMAGKDLPPAAIFVCSMCGHTAVGLAPDECPVCGAPRDKFMSVS